MGKLSNTGTAGSRLAIIITTVIVTTIVLVGGVAVATVTMNSVGSDEIINNSIKSQDIKDGTVTTTDLRNNDIRGKDIRDGTVTSVDIRNGTISAPDLAPDYLRWAKVDADGTGATLLAGRGASGANRFDTGSFLVNFDPNFGPVDGCGWLATLNDNDFGDVNPGEITARRVGNALVVKTYNSAGTLTDPSDSDGFTVQVVC